MPRGRQPDGKRAMTGAERQARYRARHAVATTPSPAYPPRPDQATDRHRPSRAEAPARRSGRAGRPAGRICRLARGPARSDPPGRHRRGPAGHRRSRPRRHPRHRTPAWLRAQLAEGSATHDTQRPAHRSRGLDPATQTLATSDHTSGTQSRANRRLANPGRARPEPLVAISWNDWSPWAGTPGRDRWNTQVIVLAALSGPPP